MKRIILQKQKINISEFDALFSETESGAVVSFAGKVREHSSGHAVNYIDYEIYNEMAEKELHKIVDSAFDLYDIFSVLVIHRFGKVKAGEVSVLIKVASKHRKPGFSASEYIIDTIKDKVPIWKEEIYE